jgi:hypothetical protein
MEITLTTEILNPGENWFFELLKNINTARLFNRPGILRIHI